MVAFPISLPAPALDSLKETPPRNIKRTQMDRGPDKIRRVTTANTRPISFTLKLTPAQTQILDDFFVNDTRSGSLSFDFVHPRTGATVKARFTDEPSYSEQQGVLYTCSVGLEILP